MLQDCDSAAQPYAERYAHEPRRLRKIVADMLAGVDEWGITPEDEALS